MDDNLTPEQAQSELATIQGDMDHAYYHRERPDHQPALERVTHLQRVITGESASGGVPPASSATPAAPVEGTPAKEGMVALPAALPEFPPEAHTEDGEMRWHEPTIQEYQAAAVELGFTGTEAMQWLDYYAKSFSRDLPDPEQTLTTLRQEWGAEFERKVNSAILAAQRLPSSVRLHLEESGLGDDPVLIRRMAEIGEQKGMSAAFEQIQKLKEDPAYWDRHDPRHKAAVDEMQRLAKQAYG